MTSYRAFTKLQEILPADGETGHGVRLRMANFFFDKPVEQNAEEHEKMLEIEAAKVGDIVSIEAQPSYLRSHRFLASSVTLSWSRSMPSANKPVLSTLTSTSPPSSIPMRT